MDTLTILKTMRAVVADIEPDRFDMGPWFELDTQCGCIVGLTLHEQPRVADELRLYLVPNGEYSLRPGDMFGAPFGDSAFVKIARLIGISEEEAVHLFCADEYPAGGAGVAGKAEALRRLDALITKYAPSETNELAAPRLSKQPA
ncbi:MAG TPA: hypothetical protein VJ890_20480 [Vineibacter sp.]|nr:hypothetical protein [Vineibacter sp.]